eukprot:gnl/TRDRNA2_/TRDRNA2_175042_c1_seq1.p1 gnl/TRDRNA2_/TRDRNA2_175042_c1~~gnl/TRDRNA2_/TRDRNA2_175042_c1_seq1.p1  ORF type:complete len:190 (-),score=16.40 gnl/TRDRNA2_/TRDRNA2_175042_c1_seq1:229-798(-)
MPSFCDTAGSITEGEIKRVHGVCIESCPAYGEDYDTQHLAVLASIDCCIPGCISEAYECQDIACEKEVLKYQKDKYKDRLEEANKQREWKGGVWFTNTTSLNTSVKISKGHQFSGAEIKEINKHCKGTCHNDDACCVVKCKVDVYECHRHRDESKYESCKKRVVLKHDTNQVRGQTEDGGDHVNNFPRR